MVNASETVLLDPADFHRLDSRLRLRGVLRARTALHVGAAQGGDQEISDLPVLKDGRGLPFIPGASLKGVLRSTLEALVRAAENEPRGIWACDSLDGDVDHRHPRTACGAHGKGGRGSIDTGRTCAVCRLLGSRAIASHVRVSDAMLREHEGASPIEIRDGVAIDRDLGTVPRSQKYQFEVVAPGTTFDLEVFVENPRDWLMGLLTIGWDQIADGFTAVGGFGSRGLGRMELQWESAEVFTAMSLLQNQPPTQWTSEALEAEQGKWRRALAQRHGGAHVQG
ncbi:CRISPR-associated RAMP protein Csx7 [Paraliomyxa miuraensis]|nr:CRISPR-associated RAMP protein Csx7 [Paraliomyxa miuraensis]